MRVTKTESQLATGDSICSASYPNHHWNSAQVKLDGNLSFVVDAPAQGHHTCSRVSDSPLASFSWEYSPFLHVDLISNTRRCDFAVLDGYLQLFAVQELKLIGLKAVENIFHAICQEVIERSQMWISQCLQNLKRQRKCKFGLYLKCPDSPCCAAS